MTLALQAFPAARKQTYAFLEGARRTCHCYLTTVVDATRLKAARAASGGRLGVTSFVVKAAGDVTMEIPEARTVLQEGLRPRVAVSEEAHAKVLFDKTVEGQRCVVSGTVSGVQARSVDEVQAVIDGYQSAAVDLSGPFAPVRRIQRLPLALVRLVFRLALRDVRRRTHAQGTYSVTSLARAPVDAVLPMIAGPLGFGIGRIADGPVVRDGQLAVAPVFTLSLAFDHRVIDGALAAEVLGRVKQRLERWEAA